MLMVGTKAVGVWKKVPFKVTKKGQDHVSDFTPFVWRPGETLLAETGLLT